MRRLSVRANSLATPSSASRHDTCSQPSIRAPPGTRVRVRVVATSSLLDASRSARHDPVLVGDASHVLPDLWLRRERAARFGVERARFSAVPESRR